MRITVLPKPIRVNILFSVVQLFCLVGLLVCFEAVKSASGQTPTQQQQTPAESQPQPEPTAISPSPSQAAIQQPERTVEANEGENKPTAFWDAKLSDWIQVGINVVLLFIVFWQARTNSEQRQIMERQVEQAKVGQRAYVGVKRIDMECFELGKEPVLRVTLINGGHTPAFKFNVPGHIRIGTEFPHERPDRGNVIGDTLLPAGVIITMNYPFNFLLTPQWVMAFETEARMIYFHGEAHYEDCWGHPRVDTIKLEYRASDGRWGSYKDPEDTKPEITIT